MQTALSSNSKSTISALLCSYCYKGRVDIQEVNDKEPKVYLLKASKETNILDNVNDN